MILNPILRAVNEALDELAKDFESLRESDSMSETLILDEKIENEIDRIKKLCRGCGDD